MGTSSVVPEIAVDFIDDRTCLKKSGISAANEIGMCEGSVKVSRKIAFARVNRS